MTLAAHVRTLGRGPGRSRSLTFDEAQDAMRLMLDPGCAPEAVGALLMLLRMKGETPDEIAGMALAARAALPALPRPALDWPSYAAGRTRGLPWFLLSARLVAAAGHPVLIHGWNGSDPAVRLGLVAAGIPVVGPDGAGAALNAHGIAYLPLETLAPRLFHLLTRREVLGLRSCVNTVCRMLNPGAAPAAVQGVFHPSYRILQAAAAQRLGLDRLTIIKGGGGEFERHHAKDITAHGHRGGAWERTFAALLPDDLRRLGEGASDFSDLSALWTGARRDPFAEAVVTGTAELALDTLGVSDPAARVRDLWQSRHARQAA